MASHTANAGPFAMLSAWYERAQNAWYFGRCGLCDRGYYSNSQMTDTTGLSAVERLRQTNDQELQAMRIDGRGCPSVVRWLVEQEIARRNASPTPSLAGYNPMGNWSKP